MEEGGVMAHQSLGIEEVPELTHHEGGEVQYAGHGIPDEQNKSAYLLPIDGYGSDVTTRCV